MHSKTLALYLGCECKVFTELMDGLLEDSGYNAILVSVGLDNFVKLELTKPSPSCVTIRKSAKEIKLLLRPLSSMTEDEAFDWFKLGYTNDVAEIKVSKDSLNHRGISVDVKFLDSRSWRVFSLHTAKAEQFQYLLSKGFDLFGLIEKGEAIDSTKL